MVLILHIICALSSIGLTTYAFLSPSESKIKISQTLMAMTLGSGTYLVLSTKANMVSACISGIAYTIFVSFGIYSASKKFEVQKSNQNEI
jgi:hypothetical protein